jgi:hypothetical protein
LVETQLIELKPEESAAEILRKKSDEAKLRREKISGLQNEVEDLLVCPSISAAFSILIRLEYGH